MTLSRGEALLRESAEALALRRAWTPEMGNGRMRKQGPVLIPRPPPPRPPHLPGECGEAREREVIRDSRSAKRELRSPCFLQGVPGGSPSFRRTFLVEHSPPSEPPPVPLFPDLGPMSLARGPALAQALGLQSVALETRQSAALETRQPSVELETWQPSAELQTWQPGFEKTMLCLARSKRQEVYIPKLGWAARSDHEFDGEAWRNYAVQINVLLGSDTYASVHKGDWVAPSAWDFDGAEWRVKRDQGGWTHAKVWHLTDDVVVEGWLPGDLVEAARQKGFEITYAQLYLGCNDTPIPHPCRSVQPLPQFRRCHATLGYLAAMSKPQMNWAMQRGDRLIKKCSRFANPHQPILQQPL